MIVSNQISLLNPCTYITAICLFATTVTMGCKAPVMNEEKLFPRDEPKGTQTHNRMSVRSVYPLTFDSSRLHLCLRNDSSSDLEAIIPLDDDWGELWLEVLDSVETKRVKATIQRMYPTGESPRIPQLLRPGECRTVVISLREMSLVQGDLQDLKTLELSIAVRFRLVVPCRAVTDDRSSWVNEVLMTEVMVVRPGFNWMPTQEGIRVAKEPLREPQVIPDD